MADSVMPAGSVPSVGADRGRLRSAVTTVVRSVTVAAGVFAPGHLGELTRQVPFELVDAVPQLVDDLGRRQRPADRSAMALALERRAAHRITRRSRS